MGVFTKKLKGLETPLAEKWDKLKSVDLLKDDIDQALKSHDFYDFKQTLETGPQLVHTLRHRSPLRCYNQYSSQLGEIFTAHYVQGSVPKVSVWTVESKTNESTYKQTSFRTACEIWSLVYVMKHRVYLAFCKDLTLRVFTDAHSAFSEVYKVQCRSSILCLRYNKYDDEIYAGGIGTVDVWKIHGAEHAASVGYVQSIKTELTKDDWVSDIQVEQKTHHMYVMYCNGITIINFRTKTKINTLLNRHEGPMKCCCFFSRFDNLLTGGVDGKIRIFNSATLNHVHMFNAHNGPVTSLVPHMKEAVLFSSSHDGTIKLWRMDSLQPFVRLDVGERIHGLALLGPKFFFFRTDCDIMIYKLNQLYHVFASVESVTTQLMQCTATDKPSRILASAEDGSVRLFSPLTGLTLTIIYPMPTFQVFTSFAYDLHQHRLYAIVTDAKGGNVLVYNTDCNPCVPIEVWSPERPEDTVTSLVLISVEFPCEDGSNDIDNLVFAGLNNGQIILCESLKCTLDTLVKAHDGAVVGLASCSHLEKCNSQTHNVSRIMVSSGTDCYTKIWLIQVSTTGRLDLILLIKINTDCAPQHICMFDNLLCVTYKSITSIGLRWVLQMYLVVGLKGGRVKNRRFLTPLRLTHSPDEDHTKELTALDKCPVGKVILTSGKDGFVKIWSMKNNLIREINFNVPIYAACFANERGDFLVGYETHICSISLVKYLPVEHLSKLSRVLCKEKKQETREVPVPFNNRAEPCDDLQKVKTYRVELLERKRQKVEEAVLARIKFQPASTCKKFVIYVDDGKTQIIRKDVADRLLTWARGKFKLKIGSVRSGDSGIGTISVRSRNSKTFSNVNSTAYFSTTSFASVEEVPLLTVADALRALHTCQDKGPIEMKLLEDEELLKKNPIIAPDGYIPNSIIRKYLKPRGGPEAPKRIEVFKPKPVPKAVPSHMPIGWGQEEEQSFTPVRILNYEDSPSPVLESEESSLSDYTVQSEESVNEPIKKKFRRKCHKDDDDSVAKELPPLEPVDLVENKELGCDDSTGEERMDMTQLFAGQQPDVQQSPSSTPPVSGEVLPAGPRKLSSKPSYKHSTTCSSDRASVTPTCKDHVTTPVQTQLLSLHRNKMEAKEVLKKKPKKMTGNIVEEVPVTEAPTVKAKESKTESRKSPEKVEANIIGKLVLEKWMPKVDNTDFEPVLEALITSLGNSNPYIFNSATTYVREIDREMGLPEEQFEKVLGKLSLSLNHGNKRIREIGIKCLEAVGSGRTEVLHILLPKLNDGESEVRKVAAEAIASLTGAHSKESLCRALEKIGILPGAFSSKEDEEMALRMLAERFTPRLGQGMEDEVFERVTDWVQGTSTGLLDENDDELSSPGRGPDGRLRKMSREGTKDSLKGRNSRRESGSRHKTLSRESSMLGNGRKESSWMANRRRESSMYSNDNKEPSMCQDGIYDTSGHNTLYNDLPDTPFSSEASDFAYSRGVSMYDAKSAGFKSESSNYNARMELLDRGGASLLPGDRLDPPTPLSDEEVTSPFKLEMERTDLTNKTRSPRSNNILLTERTLTNLSQVGPLPKFVRGNTGRDDVSVDSAFSVSEYAHSLEGLSHYSEAVTVSHLAESHHSSKVSDITDNTMFDTERGQGTDDIERGQGTDDIEMDLELEDWARALKSPQFSDFERLEPTTDTRKNAESLSRAGSSRVADIRTGSSRIADIRTGSSRIADIRTGSSGVADIEGRKNVNITGQSAIDNGRSQRQYGPADGFSNVSDVSMSKPSSLAGGRTDSPGSLNQEINIEPEACLSIPLRSPKLRSLSTSTKGSTDTTGSHRSDSAPPFIEREEDLDRTSVSCSLADTISQPSTPSPSVIRPLLPEVKTSDDIEHHVEDEFKRKHIALETIHLIESETEIDAELETEVDPELETDVDTTQLETEIDCQLETEIDCQLETDVDAQLETEIGTELETAVDFEATPVIETKTEQEIESEAELETDIETNIEPELEISHEVEIETEVEVKVKKELDETLLLDETLCLLTGDVSAKIRDNNIGPRVLTLELTSVSQRVSGSSSEPTLTEMQVLAEAVTSVRSSQLDEEKSDRFTPKGEAMYNFYRNVDPRIRASTDVRSRKSDAMTGQDSGIGRDMSFDSTQTLRLKPFASQLSPVKSVEPPIDQDDQTGAAVDRLSNQDSGFGPDMSDISQGRRGYPYAAPLSPVKSGSEASPGTSPIPAGLKKKKHKQPEEWRKFFELPNAVERRQMEVVKREMAQGKLKQTTLPPISYFAEDLPMLPGEAGTRLLQTVRIGDKNQAVGDGRHRIESVPGRLSVHTKNEAEGNSSYGIIQMRWTTSVPTTLDPSNPPVKLPHHRQHLLQDEAVFFPSVLEKYGRPRLQTAESEDDDVRLPDISRDSQHSTYRQTPSYQWELPLPPPPAKESRTNITTLKKDHDSYCKYYALVKKKLHLYTSKQREPTLHLPEVVVRQINEYRGRTREASKRKKSREPSKLNLGSLPFLPPIKLRQLVEIC